MCWGFCFECPVVLGQMEKTMFLLRVPVTNPFGGTCSCCSRPNLNRVCSVWQQRWDTWRLSFFTSSTASRLSRTSFFKPGGRKSVVHFKQNPQSSIWSCLPVGPSVPRRLVHETPETPDDCLFLPAALPIVSHKPHFLSVIGSQWCTLSLSKTLSLQFDHVFLWGRVCREG